MEFHATLIPATLLRRYKRFLSDHRLTDGRVVMAHCPNPGAMTGLDPPGAETWLAPARNPKAKLDYSWELVRVDGGLVGLNTGHPNRIAQEAIAEDSIPELAGYESIRREVAYGRNSRVDLLLERAGRPPCYVEVKNVHLKRDDGAEFPDSVTARGAKHMAELARMVDGGARAAVLFIVQREDCDSFSLARDIDPGYGEAFDAARARGVEALCYCCKLSLASIRLDRALPIIG
ncbi:MAG: DNA/RNA nuclease SfsA [Proteobacteria bacterium]|nr:DNA/RNA nuclease SfsA [Pseudomonadota bacterium]